MDQPSQQFEGNLIKAALSGGFNFMNIMKQFTDNMGAGGGGGKDGGQSDAAMQKIFDTMTHPFGNA